jgi:hypothetical protein
VEHRQGRVVVVEVGDELKATDGKSALVHVRHAGQPYIFAAVSRPLDAVSKPFDEFRMRFAFDLGLAEIESLSAEGGGASFRVTRKKSPPAAAGSVPDARVSAVEYEVTDGTKAGPFPGDKDRIQSLFTGLRKLTILKFVDVKTLKEDVGLSPAWGKLDLELGDARTLHLDIGLPTRDPDFQSLGAVHAAEVREPDSFLVRLEAVEILRQGAHALRNRAISSIDPTRIVEFEIQDGADRWRILRMSGEPWALSSLTPYAAGKELSEGKVEQFLLSLREDRFRVYRYIPELTDLAAAGVETTNPRRSFTLVDPEPQGQFRKMIYGQAVPASDPAEVTARVDSADVPPFTLLRDESPKLLDDLVRHLREITGK